MKIRILYFVLNIVLFSCISKRKDAQLHFQKASQLFAGKDIALATSEIDSATSLDTANFDYQLLKAKIKALAESFDESNNILKGLLVLNAKRDTIDFLIAENYFSLGRKYNFKEPDTIKSRYSYEQAVIWYDKAVQYNPNYFQAYFNKIKVLHNNSQYSESINTINNALKIFPNEINLIIARGITKFGLDDNNGAMTDLNYCIDSHKLDTPNLTNALRFRAEILLHKDSLYKALSDINAAIRLDGSDFLTYTTRGVIWKRMGFRDSACADFRKAADLGNTAIYSEIRNYCEK